MSNQTRQNDDAFLTSEAPPSLAWLESITITLLFIGFGWWVRPEDPFYVAGDFPWPLVAPLLVGLRYGFFLALVSSLILIGAMGIDFRTNNHHGGSFPYIWCLGLLAVGLLAGEFRDYWQEKLQKLEAVNRYRAFRLGEFTRSFHLLKVSHDRLEQQLAGSSNSLREGLRRLYREIALSPASGLNAESAELMLSLLARYGQLQIAAIYPVTNQRVGTTPLATHGKFIADDPADPLLTHALNQRTLVSVQTEFIRRRDELDTRLLAAIPMTDSSGTVMAICAVEAMPFFCFQNRTLRLLAILAGHMADMILEQQTVPGIQDQNWRHLRFQLARAGSDARQFGIPGALVGVAFTDPAPARLVAERMHRMRRGLDVVAEDLGETAQKIVILMPLTDELGLEGYLQRLDEAIREVSGDSLSHIASVGKHLISSDQDASQWLDRFLMEAPHGN